MKGSAVFGFKAPRKSRNWPQVERPCVGRGPVFGVREFAMAASRPVWKGQLRLSLVSINVEMFPAHKSGATTAFNQIHAPSGKRW